jgi:hypothetical protein
MRTRAVLASLGVGVTCPSGVGLGLENGWDGITGARENEGDIDDSRSLATEAPPVASFKIVPLDQAISWSKAVLTKLRVHLRALSLPLSTTHLSNRPRKRRHA